ncbi:SpoIID/LytB domain-containing protein [Bacteroidota bacterium]
MKKLLLLTILIILIIRSGISNPLYLNIKIFSGEFLDSVTVTPLVDGYNLIMDDSAKIELSSNTKYLFVISNNKVKMQSGGIVFGLFKTLAIKNNDVACTFLITNSLIPDRIYDNNLFIHSKGEYLEIINNVELENYVAGVVKAEVAGATDLEKFFEIQAIISRTYALNNIMKHYKDGYNLCDAVHCQVYRGHCNNVKIYNATNYTKDKVIIDKQGKMISAAFHSNSGGQTVNSEDIWSISTSYLKSVKDNYSIQMPNYKWVAKVPVKEWLTYLEEKYEFPVYDSLMVYRALNFTQETRTVYFINNIPLKYIRADLKLKSTFFSITTHNGMIYINGKGYGHGVGLSQEGAIRMIQLGFIPEEVIQFYYTDVSITDYSSLN